jgi:hypothetical protein
LESLENAICRDEFRRGNSLIAGTHLTCGIESGNVSGAHKLAVREGAKYGCPMVTLRADYELFAWWLTRERIGQDFRERYLMPEGLPTQLLKLAEKLDAVVGNRLPQEAPRNWFRKLDAMEGDQLLRACRKRLESGTRHD